MTDPNQNQQHPWSKYYAARGLARPAVADLAPARVAAKPAAAARPAAPAVSADLQAAIEAVTAQVVDPGVTAAPFITAMQKEAVAREMKRLRRVRYAKIALAAAAVLLVLHLSLTYTVFRQPLASAVSAKIAPLPEQLLPYLSSDRQPLRAEGVVIAQADRIDSSTMRYVAAVTFRLRQPLYVPAASNGTLAYRRLQETLGAARDQELRFNLFPPQQGPELPELPQLLQRTHQAGETIVVRVPFMARRFGWHWRIETPPVELRVASRALDGDSLSRYAGAPYLIFGDAATLGEVRQRVKAAHDYVLAVAKAVQRTADVVAVAQAPADEAKPVEDAAAHLPAVDPDAPALVEPAAPKLLGTATTKAYLSDRRAAGR